MKKPRVLIVENSADVTGALNSIVRSCDFLGQFFEFTFLIPDRSKNATLIRAHGFDVIHLSMRELRNNPIAILEYVPRLVINALRLKRILREKSFDLVVVNDFYNMVPSVSVLLGAGLPLVSYIRFIPTRFPPALVRLWIAVHDRTTSYFVAVSDSVRRAMPPSRIPVHVVPNEVPMYSSPAYDVNSRIILFPANYTRGKGQEFALDAFRAIADEAQGWTLRFIGGDLGLKKNQLFRDSLKQRAARLGIGSRVEWLEFQSDMSGQYGAAAMVLMFSESESFSMVCLEAMHCSRPVIATKCGGPEEIISDRIDGMLVPVGDVSAMAAAMRELVLDEQLRVTYANSAKQKADGSFPIGKSGGKLKDLYMTAIS
jgi:glycosyltransferase involved in cell wall biosynthesis